MSIGMTYDQYWYGDVRMTNAFVEAHEQRLEQQNQVAWLQGLYIYKVFAAFAPILVTMPQKDAKVQPYEEKPFQLFKKKEKTIEEQMEREEREALIAELYMSQLVIAGKKWGKKGA